MDLDDASGKDACPLALYYYRSGALENPVRIKPDGRKGVIQRMSKLVIVESPSKAKTIQKYLGSGYEVMASMGHVRDLPKARLSVDVKDGFKPKYSIIKGKEKLVKELKEAAADSDGVLLATDPDREGEAISWHLAYILGLDENAPDRVTFNEITKSGVEEGMAHPRAIDLDLVNAQQARRILDRLVGYTLSPFLAKTIRRGLSAGRVQSVAVRMIVDREEEIKAFVPQEYWSIDAKLTAPPSKAVFAAAFYGDENGEIKINSKEESDQLFAELEKEEFLVSTVKKGKKNRSPAPPFITSTLQQEASRKLGFQARRTMKAAQELYEGVEIEGVGSTGLITYMRTDSLRISEDAIRDATAYIEERWGSKYLPSKPTFIQLIALRFLFVSAQQAPAFQIPGKRAGRPRSYPAFHHQPDSRPGKKLSYFGPV